MNLARLKEIRDKQPFHPFILHLSDGRKMTIPRPDFLAFSPDRQTVAAFTRVGGVRLLEANEITELKMKRASRRKPNT